MKIFTKIFIVSIGAIVLFGFVPNAHGFNHHVPSSALSVGFSTRFGNRDFIHHIPSSALSVGFSTRFGSFGNHGFIHHAPYFPIIFHLPTAITSDAVNTTSSSTTFRGSINPNGLTTTYWFEYGTHGFTHRTPSFSIISGTHFISVTESVSGLSPNTTYVFRIVASNSAGTQQGNTQLFNTLFILPSLPPPPSLSSLPLPSLSPPLPPLPPLTPAPISSVKAVVTRAPVVKSPIAVNREIDVFLDSSISDLEVKAGETIHYILTYRNASRDRIANASIRVFLPFESEYVDSSIKPSSRTSNSLVFNIGNIEKGHQGAITIKVRAKKDALVGGSLMFNSTLEFIDIRNQSQTVNSHIAVTVAEPYAGFLASLNSLARSISGSWLFLLLFIIMFATLVYLIINKKKENNSITPQE